ncbi:claudin domain-containing protein 2 isoform X4 [Choloepus didactylus]|uniref:claudin domain-containing protein 2 isoform X4 n=1 Tax=Choloepus didactylus TaxID=27675 RepID=UPI0018A112CA|nr:claudin domain-containing protein 2 isoform X4 [Choloepus didactylus]
MSHLLSDSELSHCWDSAGGEGFISLNGPRGRGSWNSCCLTETQPRPRCVSLRGMGVKHSLQRGGTLLSLLANILMVLSAATNYWSRYPDGHSGLWQECHQGVCSISPCQSEARLLRRPQPSPRPGPRAHPPPGAGDAASTSRPHARPSARRSPRGLTRSLSPAMLAVTGACMVLAAGSGIVGMAMGLKIVSRHGDALRGQSTSAILFLSGLLLLIALTGYTVKDAWKSDVFFSWSYFAGWLALPFSILAGNREGGSKRVEETPQATPTPATLRAPPSRPPGRAHSDLPGTPAPISARPAVSTPRGPQTPLRARPASAPRPTAPLPPGFGFLLADMILQSTDAISGFPVCL